MTRVEGYTKRDGTRVQGYDTSRTKKQEEAKQPRQKRQEDAGGEYKFRKDAEELGRGIAESQDIVDAARGYDPSDTGYSVPESEDGSFMSWSKDSSPCLLYTSPSPRDMRRSRMPSSA